MKKILTVLLLILCLALSLTGCGMRNKDMNDIGNDMQSEKDRITSGIDSALDGTMGETQVGSQARLMSSASPRSRQKRSPLSMQVFPSPMRAVSEPSLTATTELCTMMWNSQAALPNTITISTPKRAK